MLNGAPEVTEHLCKKLGVKLGETTSDGKFTVMEVECLGYCDLAPVLQVNFDYHEQVNRESLDKIVAGLS